MSHLLYLDQERPSRILHWLPRRRGVPRSDDRMTLSDVIDIVQSDLYWQDAPSECEANKSLCNRFTRWSSTTPMAASTC